MQSLENRIPPPIVALIFGVAMWTVAHFSDITPVATNVRYVATAIVVVIGVSLSVLGALTFRRVGTTPNPVQIDRASSLVTHGIYQRTRNPMYLGLTIVLTGFAIWLASAWAFLGPIVFVWFITRFQVQPEERAMHKLFGNAYDDYCRRTRRWI